jgi:hypothetical protein
MPALAVKKGEQLSMLFTVLANLGQKFCSCLGEKSIARISSTGLLMTRQEVDDLAL